MAESLNVGWTTPCGDTRRSGAWPLQSQGLLNRVCLKGFPHGGFLLLRYPGLVFSSNLGCSRLCPTDWWWHIDLALHPCLGSGGERRWRAPACPAKGPGTSGNSHVLWHRHPATRVLVLAQLFSVLAQKNIIELFHWFTVSGSCAIHQTRNPPSRE